MSPFLRDERFLDSRHRSRRRFEQRAARVGGDEAADGLRGPAPRLEVPREPRLLKMDVIFEGKNGCHLLGKFCNFLAGSLSALPKRNCARKCAFDSVFQILEDIHTFAFQHLRQRTAFTPNIRKIPLFS